jgi:hypothetical protein
MGWDTETGLSYDGNLRRDGVFWVRPSLCILLFRILEKL